MPEFDHHKDALRDSQVQVSVELWERLDADLSDKDREAIRCALGKASCRAAELTAAEFQAQAHEQLPADQGVTFALELSYPDTWAEKYGGES